MSDGNGQLYRIIGANLMNSLAPAEQDYILAIASSSSWVCFCSNTKMYIVPNAKDLDPTELRTILEIQNKEFITAMDFLDDSRLVCGTVSGHIFTFDVESKERTDVAVVFDEEQVMSIDVHSNAEVVLLNTATTVYLLSAKLDKIIYKQLVNHQFKNSSDQSQISCLFNQYLLTPSSNQVQARLLSEPDKICFSVDCPQVVQLS